MGTLGVFWDRHQLSLEVFFGTGLQLMSQKNIKITNFTHLISEPVGPNQWGHYLSIILLHLTTVTLSGMSLNTVLLAPIFT